MITHPTTARALRRLCGITLLALSLTGCSRLKIEKTNAGFSAEYSRLLLNSEASITGETTTVKDGDKLTEHAEFTMERTSNSDNGRDVLVNLISFLGGLFAGKVGVP